MVKRGAENQGGFERYGGQEQDVPSDTPAKATAAQLARRRIASAKGARHARSESPTKATQSFGGFGQPQQPDQSQQFGFGNQQQQQQQPQSFQAPNAFSFGGQSSAFGASQQSGSSSFTFGQTGQSQQGNFNFNATQPSQSFPPTNGSSSPFTFGQNNTNDTGISGFSGSIFNIPGSQSPASTPQPTANGFAPINSSSASFMAGLVTDEDRNKIREREKYMTTDEMRQLEDIVRTELSDHNGDFANCLLERVPTAMQRRLLELVNSLGPVPEWKQARPNLVSVFEKGSRKKTVKPWVTEEQKEFVRQNFGKMAAADQEELAQLLKDESYWLNNQPNSAIPDVECLPNDIQHRMWEYVTMKQNEAQSSQQSQQSQQSQPSPAQTSALAFGNPFGNLQRPQSESTQQPASSKSMFDRVEKPQVNGFFTKTNLSSAPSTNDLAPTSSKTSATNSPFTFKPVNTTSSDTQPSNPTFKFGSTSPAPQQDSTSAATPNVQQMPAFNPFASIVKVATPEAASPQPAPAQPSSNDFPFQSKSPSPQPFSQGSFSAPKSDTQSQNGPSNPFSFGSQQSTPIPAQSSSQQSQNIFGKPVASSNSQPTPAPQNIFGAKPSETPSQSSSTRQNLFGAHSSQTAPTQPNIFGTPAAPKPVEQPSANISGSLSSQKPSFESSITAKSASLSQDRVEAAINSESVMATQFKVLNDALTQHLASLDNGDDWTAPLKYYIEEGVKLRKSARSQEALPSVSHSQTSMKPQSFVPAPSAGEKHKADNDFSQSSSPQKKGTTPKQAASPAKQMSSAASIMSNILDSPEPIRKPTNQASDLPVESTANGILKPASQLSSPAESATAAPAPAAASKTVSGFQLPKSSQNSSATTPGAAPVFQVPKFGATPSTSNGVPAFKVPSFGGLGGNNFLSAFGQAAEKTAAQEKAKRKLDEFDSDEDDEEEWERKDRERQEAKRQKLKEAAGGLKFVPTGSASATQSPEPSTSPQKSPHKISQASRPPIGANSASVFNSSNSVDQPSSAPANPFGGLVRVRKSIEDFKALPAAAQESADNVQVIEDDAEDEDEDEDEDGSTDVTRDVSKNDTQDEESRSPSKEPIPATPAKTGGMFGRVEQPNTAKTPQFNLGNSIFGQSSTSPGGDQTWKVESPIKFGAANGSTTPAGSPAKPATQPTFSFGGPATAESKPTASKPAGFSFGGQPSASPAKSTSSIFSPGFSSGDKPSDERPFANLFAAKPAAGDKPAGPTTSLAANLGKPAPGGDAKPLFSFGGGSTSSVFASGSLAPSQNASRATTPGTTTADEGSTAATDNENDEDAAPAEEQRDLTSLSAQEVKTESVLFESKARCKKFNRGAEEPWENKGVGIVRVLKNKETGNARVLMRQVPSGNIILNSNVMKSASMYSALGAKGVKTVFAEAGGELATYSISFGQADSAEKILGALHEVAK